MKIPKVKKYFLSMFGWFQYKRVNFGGDIGIHIDKNKRMSARKYTLTHNKNIKIYKTYT